MTSKTKDQIKQFFQQGDTPTESQFIDLIDSYVDKNGPMGQLETAASAGGQGFAFCSAGRGEVLNAPAARNFLGVTVYTTALAAAALNGTFTTTAEASAAAAAAIASAYATTAQAAAGTSPTGVMNPVLVKNAIAALGSSVIRQVKFASSAADVVGTGAYADLTSATLLDVQSGSYVLALAFVNFSCGASGLFTSVIDITDSSNNSLLVETINVGLSGNAGPAFTCGTAAANWTSPGTGNVTVKLRQNGSTSNTATSCNLVLIEYLP